ncbi:MAG: NAD(P)/FAD-dependent oxidoreductase [Chitinophagaceae bacterium]|nr:NAD(P)/FAD-dependent oxidoreductase [Chitinophagaceae bacterium]
MALTKYDAVVVGSGPNGFASAITLQRAGLSVLLVEAKATIGGGTRSAELTLPGFLHDVCSAIHPLAATSPFFKTLPLDKFGLEYIYPPLAAAHPFDDGSAAVLTNSVEETAGYLGADRQAYIDLMSPIVQSWPVLATELLAPLHFPMHPLTLAAFGRKAILPASTLVNKFLSPKAKGFFAGMAAHAIQPLTNAATSAFGLVLLATGHSGGWPVARGGSQSISNALAAYFVSLGGVIETNRPIATLNDLPPAKAIIFDVTPKQLLQIAGEQFSAFYKWQMKRFVYGMGVFKIDWALNEPIPFTNADCRLAGTIHLGSTYEEIARGEQQSSDGIIVDKPYVLLAQQSIFDHLRAPTGKHTAWAYCHVPNGSATDMTNAIEQQVERYAPGFMQTILARHTMNTIQMEAYNPNFVGGDINGGIINLAQLFTRPVISFSPYNTPAKGIYIGSSSTPPGGGVHGMCGYYAAKRALKDVFGMAEKVGLAT